MWRRLPVCAWTGRDACPTCGQSHFQFATLKPSGYIPASVIGHIREEVEKFGLTTKWTMAALAEEYHQSMTIEKTIKDDPAKRDAWIKRQLLLEPATSMADEDVANLEDAAQPALELTLQS